MKRATAEIGGFSRRSFLLGLGTAAVGAWAVSQAGAGEARKGPMELDAGVIPGKELVVQPVLIYDVPRRRDRTSWRSWGGVHTKEAADQEKGRIEDELGKVGQSCEFGVKFLPVVEVVSKAEAEKARELECDVMLIYAAGGGVDALEALVSTTRPTIFFLRHKSGPVSLWYEIMHPRFLRKTVDQYAPTGADVYDVVVDEGQDLVWRLRGLYGLKNSWGERIIAIGDAGGWGRGGQKAPQLARDQWHMELLPVSYEDLGKRFKSAMADPQRMAKCQAAATALLAEAGVKLETQREFVDRCFVVAEVFKDLMHEMSTRAITVNHCMGTIMQVTETTACLPLMILNDQGYMAFCESDFVVIPSGVLLHHISGLPVFLNDPTYPHHGIVTVAHCTGPRKMSGRRTEPARIMTHFESDYGASPKVEFPAGERITMIDPDFDGRKWLGFTGKTLETPFMSICRAQVDVTIEGDWERLLEEMVGFHWMMSYGDRRKEVGYALKKAGIQWVDVSEKA
jgi:hypothetical protein